MRYSPGLTEQDILLAVTTISFDIAGLELYLPLMVGARVVLASQEESIDGERLLKKLISSEATIMQATPVSWRLLLAAGWEGKPPIKVLCGGEAFPRELANQLTARSSSVWNMYGPTETTIWSTICKITRQEDSISIGHPIANTQIYILDSHLQPTPVGVSGELYIGGDGMSRGYLNRPGLTTERFVPDPFNDEPGRKLYRTGDVARYLPDGRIEFFGRLDHQVKIRGFRIELGEIETELAAYPGVRETVVLAREDQAGDKRLVAYLVLDQQPAPSISKLRDFLKEKLPDYMVPTAFVILDVFPLTPNGKIDRRALPAPDRSGLEEDYVAPRTSTEQTLADIWANILGVEQFGIHDNFFELGGHSLLAMQVISRMREAVGVELPVRNLFEAPNIAKLAEVVVAKQLEYVESEALEQVLAEAEQLSDTEVARQLSAE
jgi:acyl-coenzyme A synthetase/AMP-(fatty) acid ligase/acyl carrier protein